MQTSNLTQLQFTNFGMYVYYKTVCVILCLFTNAFTTAYLWDDWMVYWSGLGKKVVMDSFCRYNPNIFQETIKIDKIPVKIVKNHTRLSKQEAGVLTTYVWYSIYCKPKFQQTTHCNCLYFVWTHPANSLPLCYSFSYFTWYDKNKKWCLHVKQVSTNDLMVLPLTSHRFLFFIYINILIININQFFMSIWKHIKIALFHTIILNRAFCY
jgi:hypothetical protein